MWFLLAVALLVSQGHASAKEIMEIEPQLSTVALRSFDEVHDPDVQKTVSFTGKGSRLILGYTADAPFELQVSFPLHYSSSSQFTVQPLHTLVAKLPQGEDTLIAIDLTLSPAWSAGRAQYALHVLGPVGSTILIQRLEMEEQSFFHSLRAYVRQFFIDEPTLLSSINFLHGYYLAGRSLTVVLGLLFLTSIVLALLLSQKRRRAILLVCLVTLLVYDARFSLDLLRTTAQDLQQWYGEQQYRQLGSLLPIVEVLQGELRELEGDMVVAVCSDETDLLNKHLRYHLYPVPVGWVEEIGSKATHLVVMATGRGVVEGDRMSCGPEFHRQGHVLRAFSDNSLVARFAAP